MKKKSRLRKILVGAAIAVVVLLLFLQFGLGLAVKHGVQAAGPMLLGCDVSIGSCRLHPLSGVVDMQGVVVGPPEGFDANLFEMDRLRVDFSPLSVFGSEPLLIHEIAVTNVLVTYELKGLDSNISAVTKKLGADEEEEETPDGDAEEAEEPDETGEKSEETEEEAEPEEASGDETDDGGKKVVIEHFVFSGAKVRAAFWDGKGIKPPLPTIELTDIGKKTGGATVLEAVGSVFGSIGKGVIGLVADLGGAVVDAAAAAGEAAVDGAVAAGEAVGDAAEAAGEAVGDAAEAAGEAIGDAAEAVGDAIGNLFD